MYVTERNNKIMMWPLMRQVQESGPGHSTRAHANCTKEAYFSAEFNN